ncbi:cytochrome c [Motiliproteus sediminis]|uniref:cytochrome c n=1 Tax=Motiliproteus sediminis TaxID=1468178 RepID=UPI001AEF8C39|nr:cytochrome c [Motiliproteus sediminis]
MYLTKLLSTVTAAAVLSAVTLPAVAEQDGRHSIVLRPKEQAMMLEDMRRYLHGIRKITTALSREDNAAVEKAARELGTIAIYEVKPIANDPLVPRFRSLATRLHEEFEEMADAAKEGETPNQLLRRLSKLMNQCVKCHETYKTGSYPQQY